MNTIWDTPQPKTRIGRVWLFLRKWFRNIIVAIDRLGNALACGDSAETISSRCGRLVFEASKGARTCYPCKYICEALNKIQLNHCRIYIEVLSYPGKKDLLFPVTIDLHEEKQKYIDAQKQ